LAGALSGDGLAPVAAIPGGAMSPSVLPDITRPKASVPGHGRRPVRRADLGIKAETAVYDEAFADKVRAQLLSANGMLVWVDPIHQGKARPSAISGEDGVPRLVRRYGELGCPMLPLGRRIGRLSLSGPPEIGGCFLPILT
jgi:hypothetical protein